MAKTPTDIRSLARKHTALALRVLKEVASSPKANQSARVAAAQALLDRGWGKPKQTMEHTGENPLAALLGPAFAAQRVQPDESDDCATH